MRYAPYQEEIVTTAQMNDAQLFEYFLTRVYETEEVWGIDDGCEWITLRRENQLVMPVWPYRHFAATAFSDLGQDNQPTAESLEDFVYHTLAALIEEDTMLEIMSSSQRQGCMVSPHRLLEIFQGMFDAGEYTLDS